MIMVAACIGVGWWSAGHSIKIGSHFYRSNFEFIPYELKCHRYLGFHNFSSPSGYDTCEIGFFYIERD